MEQRIALDVAEVKLGGGRTQAEQEERGAVENVGGHSGRQAPAEYGKGKAGQTTERLVGEAGVQSQGLVRQAEELKAEKRREGFGEGHVL